jgi:hypothetical protein
MTDNSIFNGSDDNTPALDETKNYFDELVGEGKAFKDAAALARSKVEGNFHIKRIEEENAKLRQEVAIRKNMQELVDQFRTAPPPDEHSNQNTNTDETDTGKSLTPDEIRRQISAEFEQRERSAVESRNIEMVRETLSATFGNDVNNALTSKLSELGLSKDDADRMAKTQPKAFLALFGKPQQTQVPNPSIFSPPSSSVNPAALNRGSNETKNFKYYDDMRRKIGNRKFEGDTRLQAEIHAAALRMGEAFFQ